MSRISDSDLSTASLCSDRYIRLCDLEEVRTDDNVKEVHRVLDQLEYVGIL